MASTTIISNISRSESYPKIVAVSTGKNMGYLSMDVSTWTNQMRSEIPAIQINIYTKLNSMNIRYTPVSIMLPTNRNISQGLYDIPETFYLSVQPLFDPYCIKAHNQLVKNGLETEEWTQTDSFDINLTFDDVSGAPFTPETITDVPPISFQSDGTPLTNWSIVGNMEQTETPTKTLPSIPQECGDLVSSGQHSGEYEFPITVGSSTQTAYLLEPIRKLQTYTDTMDSTGTATRIIKKITLTGNEDNLRYNTCPYIEINDAIYTENEVTCCCTHYLAKPNAGLSAILGYGDGCLAFRTVLQQLRIVDNAITTIDEFKTFLQTQYQNGTPVCIWYVLNAETTEQFTAPTITPAKGSNTLSIGTTLQPTQVSITGDIK